MEIEINECEVKIKNTTSITPSLRMEIVNMLSEKFYFEQNSPEVRNNMKVEIQKLIRVYNRKIAIENLIRNN